MHRRHGYTLVEMLTTVAALLIVLGLMVNLTRHVRSSSASALTKSLLRRLDDAMAQYVRRQGGLPVEENSFITDNAPVVENAALARRAQVNSQSVVRLLKAAHLLPPDGFDDLPASCYDGRVIRDAWGSPVVFMSSMNPAVGMAAKGWFFFSAGPDRKYTTKSDNLYSYELPTAAQTQP
jgi:prepilin-type N-terminal cleavage/methylation domain-containing protein